MEIILEVTSILFILSVSSESSAQEVLREKRSPQYYDWSPPPPPPYNSWKPPPPDGRWASTEERLRLENDEKPRTSDKQWNSASSELWRAPRDHNSRPPPPSDHYDRPPPPPPDHYGRPPPPFEDFGRHPPPRDPYGRPPPPDHYGRPPPHDDRYRPPPHGDHYRPPPHDDRYRPPPHGDHYRPPPHDDHHRPPPHDDYYRPPPPYGHYSRPPPPPPPPPPPDQYTGYSSPHYHYGKHSPPDRNDRYLPQDQISSNQNSPSDQNNRQQNKDEELIHYLKLIFDGQNVSTSTPPADSGSFKTNSYPSNLKFPEDPLTGNKIEFQLNKNTQSVQSTEKPYIFDLRDGFGLDGTNPQNTNAKLKIANNQMSTQSSQPISKPFIVPLFQAVPVTPKTN